MAFMTKSQLKDVGWTALVILAVVFLFEKVLPAKFRGYVFNG